MIAVEWETVKTGPASLCPVCGNEGFKISVLRTGGADRTRNLLQCPVCEARYAEPLIPADYENADEDGLVFYLEQGAGLRSMLEPLALTDPRAIQRYLEIGCSFGFVMDYARRMLGWDVRGFDPGFIAKAGKQQLNLPIENTYFSGLDSLGTRVDLLFCSEVIEHIPDPRTFASRLGDALNECGVLLLTTPNGDALSPSLPAQLLLPLLSPGQHLILYNIKSLETLLRGIGFTHFRVNDGGHQLQVAASRTPFVGNSRYFSAEVFHRYLEETAAVHDVTTPLGAGLVGRLLKEKVNSGQFDQAQSLYLLLQDGYMQRFGIDIEDPQSCCSDFPLGSGLQEFSAKWPFNLTGVWYARGMIQLLYKNEPQNAAHTFAAATRFGASLRGVLHDLGLDDAETAELCREAEIAHLRCLAKCNPVLAIKTFIGLSCASSVRAGAALINGEEYERARRALFSDLVHLGNYSAAEKIITGGSIPLFDADDPNSIAIGFACGLYLLNHTCDVANAASIFNRLRQTSMRSLGSDTPDELSSRYLPEIEMAWISALVRSDPLEALTAYTQIYGASAPADWAPVTIGAPRHRLSSRLFTDLVNLGNYSIAEQVLHLCPTLEQSLKYEAHTAFAWGLYLLNYKAEFPEAARVFACVWQQAQCAGDSLLWPARFHQGLASRYCGDAYTASAIAAEIRKAGAASPGADRLRSRLHELMVD